MSTYTPISQVQEELGVTEPLGVRSCAMCPSAMSSSQLQGITGKGIGGPVCARWLKPLVRPDQSERVKRRVLRNTASICKDFGKDRPDMDANSMNAPVMYGTVGLGMPTVRPSEGTASVAKPSNCLSCINYIAPQVVASETGWSAGLCVAKGKLLTPDRLRVYATGCKDSVYATGETIRATLDKFMFNPEFTKAFGEVDIFAAAAKIRNTEPGDWPTDKPVTPADAAKGIHSWRKISDPEGVGADAYLPILRADAVAEKEQSLIPRTGDDEHPEIYRDHGGVVYEMAVLMFQLRMIPAVWGEPGVGKTELGRHLAWLMRSPFARISITGQSDIDDLAGKLLFSQEKGTYFQYGRIPTRWERPGVTVLDEPNVGPNEVWQFIRPMTDSSKQLVLDGDTGQLSIRNWLSFLYLAMNPAWDPRNVGTNTIGDADARRLTHVWMAQPTEEVEMEIIKDHCMVIDQYDPTPHLKNMMKISKEIRPMCKAGQLPITWGTAVNIKIARLLKWFSPLRAYEVGMTNFLDPRVADTVLKSVKSVYPNL